MRDAKPKIRVGPRLVTAERAFAAMCRLAEIHEPRRTTVEGCKQAVSILEPYRRDQLLEEIDRGPAKGSRKMKRLAARGF